MGRLLSVTPGAGSTVLGEGGNASMSRTSASARIRWEVLRRNGDGSVTETGEEKSGVARSVRRRCILLEEEDYASRSGLHDDPLVLRRREVVVAPHGSQEW